MELNFELGNNQNQYHNYKTPIEKASTPGAIQVLEDLKYTLIQIYG
jgi:hypothetical protein